MGIVERLRAIDEEAMYQAPATTHRTVAEAATAIETLAEALREARSRVDLPGAYIGHSGNEALLDKIDAALRQLEPATIEKRVAP